MAVNTQFSIAVHIMAALGCLHDGDMTSARLARSVNTSPSFLRRILAKLSKAGLVLTVTGKNGACWLARKPADISLLDIYEAVEAPKAFSIHGYATQRPCIVSCNIKSSLNRVLARTQNAMETSLGKISLAEIIADVRKK